VSRWIVEDARGARRPERETFPLSVGGPGCAVELPGLSGTAAWLGLSGDELFVQAGDAEVTCNGLPVRASQWLRPGDVLRVGTARLAIEATPDGLRLRVEGIETREDRGDPIVVVAAPPDAAAPATTIRPVDYRPRPGPGGRRPRRRLRPVPLLVLALVAAVLGVAGWVLSLPRVDLEVVPAPDRLSLEGAWPALRLGGRRLLRPGTYRLTAEKEGYRPLDVPLEVTRDGEGRFAFDLEPLPGRVRIEAPDLDGLQVLVDGVPVPGEPPLSLELEPGEHEVRVRADRHGEFVRNVMVEGRGVEQTVTAELTNLGAAVRFDSRPAGARLLVDGAAVGMTPITASLMPGTHRLEFRLEGHRTVRESIVVETGDPRTWPTVTLPVLEGIVRLRSEPDGATVRVDGAYRGQTPVEVAVEAGVEHRVELTKSGHAAASRALQVSPGETAEWTATLTPRLGELVFRVTPAGAELLVDGEARGPAEGSLELPAVPHELEVRLAGHEPYRATVTPRPGFPETIEVDLQPLHPDVAATAPTRTESPAGQALILIDGGRFRMGASRREPGRRANETLRDVQLTRPFYLAAKPVTNDEFRGFREEHLSGKAGDHSLEYGHHPVVRVSWEDAAAYCNWLSRKASLPEAYVERGGRLVAVRPLNAGYRLPLEAEWAWAARYHDGPEPRKFPWGDSLPVAAGSGNYADASAAGLLAQVLTDYDDGYPVTSPAGAFPTNGIGLYDLGGNVAEWVHDVYGIPGSTAGEAVVDPTGPGSGDLHTIRGSGWMHSTVSELRLTYRDYGSEPRPDVGFRVARYVQ
jgi:formylglycine-generating enzyme required for sulfatase activity